MTIRKKNIPVIVKNQYEKAFWGEGLLVCGIDEVGRGCLAGPLVTAAVILPVNKTSPKIKDSKLTTLQERLEAFRWIQRHCWFNIGIVHHRLIDQCNIWQATLIAMRKALINLLETCPRKPSAILVDAMPLNLHGTNYTDIPIHSFCHGERKSSSIAAASIVAKVVRDELMTKFNGIIPGYSFDKHKGYGTPLHKQALDDLRPCILHRDSFLSHTTQKIGDHENQQTLC